MSRGLGRIETAIAAAFISQPSRTFTVAELAAIVYPQMKEITKSHRVATIRAADKVAGVMGWNKSVGGTPREARYGRPIGPPAVSAVPETAAAPAALGGPADVLADRVAANMIAFLSGVLDPAGVATFVGELDRTSVEHLRRRL